MSKTNRWYVLGRKVALDHTEITEMVPGTVYVFEGWHRTKDAAVAHRDKLDRAGRQGIDVFSPSRRQAAQDVFDCYGAKVEGYVDRAAKRMGQMIVRAAVVREIFCPFTGMVMDMRRAVVIVTPTRSFVCSAEHWDVSVAVAGGIDALRAALAEKLGRPADVDVYDGRELFKR